MHLLKTEEKQAPPGFDLLSGIYLKLVMIRYLFNAVIRLRYAPEIWKVAKMIMLLKKKEFNHSQFIQTIFDNILVHHRSHF